MDWPASMLEAVRLGAAAAAEDVLALERDLDAQGLGQVVELALELGELDRLAQLDQHGHGEDALQDGLGDVEDVGLALGQGAADRGDDAGTVASQDGDDRAVAGLGVGSRHGSSSVVGTRKPLGAPHARSNTVNSI